MEIHDLCGLFPEMPREEIGSLVEHISKFGQIHPIVTYEGKILDGRNRHLACCILGRDPWFEEWAGQGETPLAFVVGCNLTRRNLTPSQRAAIALDVKDRLTEGYRERQLAGLKRGVFKPAESRSPTIWGTGREAAKEAAAMMQVNHVYVSDASRIRERSPETLEAIKAGKITISQAKRDLFKSEPAAPSPITTLAAAVERLAVDHGGSGEPAVLKAVRGLRSIASNLRKEAARLRVDLARHQGKQP